MSILRSHVLLIQKKNDKCPCQTVAFVLDQCGIEGSFIITTSHPRNLRACMFYVPCIQDRASCLKKRCFSSHFEQVWRSCVQSGEVYSKQYWFFRRNPSVLIPINPRRTLAGFSWGCMVLVLKGSYTYQLIPQCLSALWSESPDIMAHWELFNYLRVTAIVSWHTGCTSWSGG